MALALVTSCSYDWSTGAEPADAQDATAIDGSAVDASGVDASIPEASGSDVAVDSVVVDSAPTCASLLADLVTARTFAKTCTLPNPMACTLVVAADECGCKQIVNQGKSQYETTIARYTTAGCSNPACTSCNMSPQPGLCVASDASTSGLACTQ